MPITKNVLARFQALDRCLSNWNRRYYIEDLIDACNKALVKLNGDGGAKGAEQVQRRTVLKDLNDLESAYDYTVRVDRIRDGRRTYYRYERRDMTIQNSPISSEESDIISQALMVLKRFKGMPQFDWLDEAEIKLDAASTLGNNMSDVVSFQSNPELVGLNDWYKPLFNAIVNRRVVEIQYHPYGKPVFVDYVSPYQLKQYNNRWFLICQGNRFKDGLTNYALDRIEDVKETSRKYTPTDTNFEDYFYDYVGVTVTNTPLEEVVLRVKPECVNFIRTKPLHPSQRLITKQYEDGRWEVVIKVRFNYELRALLRSFGDDIEVMSPASLRNEMKASAERLSKLYAEE